MDVEEWGQVVIVNMLSRYARTQFVDPNAHDTLDEIEREKDFYENSESDDEDEEDSDSDKKKKKAKKPERPKMDPDHRLLLRSAKPLLQSRNASVVMATAQLYHHCAPRAEVQVVAKAMIRLLRSHREVQALVLNSIASMTSSSRQRNSMFEPHLRNFFVRSSDPTHIKILKLEIITNMATQSNIGVILREFQSYITSQDKVCVAATIQAIGRCAATIEEVTDTCLNGLVHLLSNREQAVVAESVVVIKKLLQTQAGDHKEIIVQMAKLVDSINVPAARAAILWVVGEYCERVPKVAPDVLRKMTKSFVTEEPQVKMQVLNLAAKLCISNPEQSRLLAQYVFNLAKYDQDYDIRDRARFIRAFIFPQAGQEESRLVKNARKVFLANKPAPVTESKFKDRDIFQLGSLSHFLNARATGYQDLPEFPSEAPDPSVRNVEPPPRAQNPWEKSPAKAASPAKEKKRKSSNKSSSKGFYSEESTEEDKNGESSSGSGSSSGTSDSSSSSSGSESESDEEEEVPKTKAAGQVNGARKKHPQAPAKKAVVATKKAQDSESESESSSGSGTSSSESSSEEEEAKPPPKRRGGGGGAKKPPQKKEKDAPAPPKSNLDLLLDLSDAPPSIPTPAMTPSMGGFLTPSSSSSPAMVPSDAVREASPAFVPSRPKELINKMASGGLQLLYRYTRSPHIYSAEMCSVELTLNNQGDEPLADVKVGAKHLAPGMALHEFPGLAALQPGASANVTIGVNFNDTTQAAKFDLIASGRCHAVRFSLLLFSRRFPWVNLF